MNGVYYPVGKAICQIVNRDLRTHGVRCSPEATPGSVYNTGAIQSGELEFGIIQSDVQFAAYKGRGRVDRQSRFSVCDRCCPCTRSSSPSLLVQIRTSRILRDWQADGSMWAARAPVLRATWDAIEAELGWRDEQRVRPIELRPDATTSALCSGAIDANHADRRTPIAAGQVSASRLCDQLGRDCRSGHRQIASRSSCIINAGSYLATSMGWQPTCRPSAFARPW